MSRATNNILKMPDNQRTKPKLDLPRPRVWTAQDLAAFLRVSLSWVHKRTKKNSPDPPPRCPGISDLRFDTQNPKFQDWLARQIGADIDTEDEADV